MELCLDVGNAQILSDLPIEQLQNWELFPELIRKIAVEDLIEEVAYLESIDLNSTAAEFEELLTEISQIPTFDGMNVVQLTAITERELKLQKFKQGKWGKEVETYFQTHQAGLGRVIISILQIADGALAQELFFRIESGESSFAEIALDHSQGKYAELGGILGPLFVRELAPSIAKIVTELKPGKLSSLFQIDGFYTLFRLDELSSAELDKGMNRFLLDELFSSWVKTEIGTPSQNPTIGVDRIVYYLSRSELLIPYLQQSIIEETVARWQTSSECVDPSPDLAPQERKVALLQQYKRSEWGHLLKSHFLQYKTQLDRVLFSIVQVPNLSIAQELYYQSRDQGHSLHKIAKVHSQHPTATRGGSLGPIGFSQLNPLIQHHLTGIAPKQLSQLFQLDEDYLFLRVDRWLPAQFNEQVEQILLDRLFGQWLQQQLRDRLGEPDSISFSPVIDLVESQQPQPKKVQIATVVELPPEPTGTLSPTSSFFFPQVSLSGSILPLTADDEQEPITNSSFFFPQQESPILPTPTPPSSRAKVLAARLITFFGFFCLFLGAEIGLIYWLNPAVIPTATQQDRDQ